MTRGLSTAGSSPDDPIVRGEVKGVPVPREAQLASLFVEIAYNLVEDFGAVELLGVLSDQCVKVFDISAAGVMLAGPDGDLRVVASSSEAMRMLEVFELQSADGPCPDCYRTGRPILNKRLATADDIWPQFALRAVGAGFKSAHALPMRLRGSVIGALNLFREDEGEMEEADVQIAQAFADIATVTILQERAASDTELTTEQAHRILDDRIVIEQATGILSEVADLDIEHAFLRLRDYAHRNHRRLVDTAQDIVDSKLNAMSC